MGLKEKDILKCALFCGGDTIVALISVSPLLWIIVVSLKPEVQIFPGMDNVRMSWPTAATPENYVEVFTRINMVKFTLNSLFYMFVIVILNPAIDSICGYALAGFNSPRRGLLLTVVTSLMVLPMEATMLPLHKGVVSLRWVNTQAGLTVPFVGKHFPIYMSRQFFLDILDDLLETIVIDGCSPIKTFFTIIMPISGTVYATILVLGFMVHWDDFMWPMLVVTGKDMRATQLVIQAFFGSKPVHYGVIMASLAVSAVPMLLMFVFLQKYYMEGIISAGIKGQQKAGAEEGLRHTLFPLFP